MLLLLNRFVTLVKLLYLSECQFLLLSNEMVGSRSVFPKVLDHEWYKKQFYVVQLYIFMIDLYLF